MCALIAAIAIIYILADAFINGRIRTIGQTTYRSEEPITFWALLMFIILITITLAIHVEVILGNITQQQEKYFGVFIIIGFLIAIFVGAIGWFFNNKKSTFMDLVAGAFTLGLSLLLLTNEKIDQGLDLGDFLSKTQQLWAYYGLTVYLFALSILSFARAAYYFHSEENHSQKNF